MRGLLLIILAIGATAGATRGQTILRDGDLVIQYGNFSFSGGATLSLRPSTGAWSTLMTNPLAVPRGVRMAADNTGLVAGTWNAGASQHNLLIRIEPGGAWSTLTGIPDGGAALGIGLDHDGWILASPGKHADAAFRVSLPGYAVTTLFGVPHTRSTIQGGFFDMTIDRDPGAPAYVMARWQPSNTMVTPRLEGADRHGIVTTIYSSNTDTLRCIHGVELDPVRGDYLVSVAPPTTHLYLSHLVLVSKDGLRITTLTSGVSGPVSATVKVNQDDTAWVAGRPNGVDAVLAYRVDLATGKILQSWKYALSGVWPSGIEVYGSRRLTCSGTGVPGTTVSVRLKSHKAADAGLDYALACSFARRPGVRFASGERLDLNVTDDLFRISALGLLPAIFQDFQGRLDAFGAATARVNVPRSLPRHLGVTVFVGGVIFDPKAVSTVTNTHWFVLD